ncbi:hypothetical protein [Aeromonas sp. QDB08]|uniref:hypothetical protein n=1 Tax=Aeromonas sp. QDB08 TaxID=2990480 RepID=UPI0022E7446B|nr:hypothetical protein [Aeromonas sp. QDB08]
MSHHLISELQTRVDRWRETMLDDAARLRYYQRNLLAMRRLSPRPHNSVALTLRQCASARKMMNHASYALAACRNSIKKLSGRDHQ